MTSFEEYGDQYHRLFTDADKAYRGVLDALNTLADTISSLAIASGEQTAYMRRLQREHDELQREHDELQQKYDALQQKYDALQQKYDALQQKYDALHEWCSGAPVIEEVY